jgi:hypothetical protein
MSQRRAGSSASSSVIVEFHEFDGRWFVTDRWGSGSGIRVRRPIRKSRLGRAVLERVQAARSEWRSFITPADHAEHWARFCVDEAGVPPEKYRPEKRLVILVGQAGIQCQDARRSPPSWEPLPARSPRALGAALLARIGQVDPGPPEPVPPEMPVPSETAESHPVSEESPLSVRNNRG